MSIKAFHLLTDTDRRGAQLFGVGLASRLAELGVSNRILALRRTSAALPEVEAPTSDRRMSPTALLGIRSAMKSADLTIAHGSSTLAACALAGVGVDRPVVYRQISDPVFWTPTVARRARVRMWYRSADHVVSLSSKTAPVLTERFGVRPEAITVIPNGADERHFEPRTAESTARAKLDFNIAGDRAVIAFAGALTVEKGLHELIEAVPKDAVLLVAGDGPEASFLTRHAAGRGVDVRLIGVLPDSLPLYSAADLVVLPSWSEQQPAVLIEAALCGVPSVATDVGLVNEVVLDGQTGWLVPPRDPQALTDAIGAALGNPNRSARFGGAARAHALEHFSLTSVAHRWYDLLVRLAR